MKQNNGFNHRYDVITYTGPGSVPEARTMTLAEVKAINLQGYDHVTFLPCDLLAFRNASGQWVEKRLEGSGLGQVCLNIQEVIQMSPGEFVGCWEIDLLLNDQDLRGANALAARIRMLRRVHGETPQSPRFFVTRRRDYALMWPAERSYILIRRIHNTDTDGA